MKQELLNELITSLGLAVEHIGDDIATYKFEGLAVKVEELRDLITHLDGAMRLRKLVN